MKSILVLLSLSILLSSCATVVKSPSQSVSVKSVPAGADVLVSNGKKGVTPFAFRASRKEDCRVSVSKEGFQPVSITLRSVFSTSGRVATAGNALVGGLIGTAIDQASGATLELQPDSVLVRLSPTKSRTPSIVLSPGSKLEESTGRSQDTPQPSRNKPAVTKPVQGRTDAQGTEYL
jgi:hypothetical protein